MFFAAAASLLAAVPANAAPANVATAKTPHLTHWQEIHERIFRDYAPADRYFGPLKYSVTEIENIFHDTNIRSGPFTTDPHIVHDVAMADAALRDWDKHYPRDPQLSHAYYLASRSYAKIWIKTAQERGWRYLNLVAHRFRNTYFGRVASASLAVGYTEHYYAAADLCTPAPTATPLAAPPPRGRAHVTPSPVPSPGDTPSPAPSATPAPPHGQPKVQIEITPCVTPAPSPAPTESASPLLSPAPSPSASASR
jgi:hypothetical protein